MNFSLVGETHKLYVFFDTVPKTYSIIDGEEKTLNMDIEKGQVVSDVNMYFNGKKVGILIGVEKGKAIRFYFNDIHFLIGKIPECIEVLTQYLFSTFHSNYNVTQIGVNSFMLTENNVDDYFKLGHFYNWEGESTLELVNICRVTNWSMKKNLLGDEISKLGEGKFKFELTKRIEFKGPYYTVYYFPEIKTTVVHHVDTNKILITKVQEYSDFEPIADVNQRLEYLKDNVNK